MAEDTATTNPSTSPAEVLDKVVIRFAGDSGDGMQVAGNRFTDASALFGNDLATLPSFPAEIRAPAGTLPGVSSFQVQIADFDVLTAGDAPDCLVAMNPAALKNHLKELRPGGTLIVNVDTFDERNLAKAGYESNPLEDDTLDGYRAIKVPMDDLTKEAVKGTGVSGRSVLRSKNFFALGLLAWLFHRPTDPTIEWVKKKFASKPEVVAANNAAFKAGYTFGVATEATKTTFAIKPASLRPGTYTNVNGNTALAWGLIAASQKSGLPLFYGTYPITPASDILHELSRHRNFGVRTFQAEDEIAAIGSTIGAAFAGNLAVTGSSGPGIALKSEGISLAFMTELPLIVINVQRGGPSTGLPTKPEQSDLLFSLYGRHGESPLPVIAAASPSDAFEVAIEAARIAIKYMTPVILLSDNNVANASEPWLLPDLDDIPDIEVKFSEYPNGPDGTFSPTCAMSTLSPDLGPSPALRDWSTASVGWRRKPSPGISRTTPKNHQLMTDTRAWKVANIVNDIPPLEIHGDEDADLLIVGWGSTFGPIRAASRQARLEGRKVATTHLRYLNPMPSNTGEVLASFDKLLIPEMNTGQLLKLVRAEFLIDAVGLNKVAGEPFKVAEIAEKIMEMTK